MEEKTEMAKDNLLERFSEDGRKGGEGRRKERRGRRVGKSGEEGANVKRRGIQLRHT